MTLAADPSRGRLVMAGGDSNNTLGSDTWTWDGRAWTYRAGSLPSGSALAQTRPYGHGGDDCVADLAPDVTSSAHATGWLSLEVSLVQSCVSKGLTMQLVDRESRHPLAVAGNAKPIAVTALTFRWAWRNWCAQPDQVAALRFDVHGVGVVITVLAPPPCLDPNQPSTLMTKATG